ncbi:hypothetical protein NOS3756_21490 [Nostoc sp. NIES-3756]|nr:hypothetical protein NOS3756_21490 [Nostoc sp. NIES-3756]
MGNINMKTQNLKFKVNKYTVNLEKHEKGHKGNSFPYTPTHLNN